MAEAIPGSYVVFSAMKKQLSDGEKSRIRKLAEWGRVPQKNGEPRAMVIVLTGTELFADHYVKQTWQETGGAHANMVNHPSVHIDDLWTLADVTQQLYLDLPAYWNGDKKDAGPASTLRDLNGAHVLTNADAAAYRDFAPRRLRQSFRPRFPARSPEVRHRPPA
jgi:hypothetical protein